jgi:Uma2 family endonuclease
MAFRSPAMTLAELLERFGLMPAVGLRSAPPPGSAADLALRLGRFLTAFADHHDLGLVAGEAGRLRLAPGLVRRPAVSFGAWERFPQRQIPRQPIPDLIPDLVVEVLRTGKTPREMEQTW